MLFQLNESIYRNALLLDSGGNLCILLESAILFLKQEFPYYKRKTTEVIYSIVKMELVVQIKTETW